MESSNDYVEGIGNDLFCGLIYTIPIFIIGVYLLYRMYRSHSNQTVHPSQASQVLSVRQSLSRVEAEHQPMRSFDMDCPICLTPVQMPVETNCGHVFCARCIVTYWQFGSFNSAMTCPVCRQRVNLLIQCSHDPQLVSMYREHIEQVLLYNRRFSGRPLTWREQIDDLPVLLRHLVSDLFSLHGLVWMFRVRIILCVAIAFMYCLSPFDIIPEAAFGIFGFLDDIFILMLVAIYVSVIYRNYVGSRSGSE